MITPGTNSFGGFHLPLGAWVSAIVDWITTYLSGFFDVVRYVFTWMDAWMEYFLSTPPFWVVVLVIVALAFWARGWKLALGAAIGLVFIVSVGQWTNAMQTLALVIVAAGLAVVFSIPLGIWAARSDAASRIIRPVIVHSSARLMPTTRGRKKADAPSGTMPRCVKMKPNFAFVDASRMSIGSSIVAPTPTAGPLIAAITGLRLLWMRRVACPAMSRTRRWV